MEARPRLKLTLSPLDKTLEVASKIFLFVIWCLTVYTFFKMPATIPTHFNALGKPDGYGSKMTILILPGIGTIIYFGLTKVNNYPHLFNYLAKITEDNAQKQYSIATRTLRCLKLAILIIFSLIILFTYLATIGVTNGLGFWFLPIMVGFVLIPVAISLRGSLKKKNNPV